MLPTPPSVIPTWTDGNPAKQVQPPTPVQTLGWTAGERPPFQYMNWLFWLTGLWITWLYTAVQQILTNYALYDAIVDGVNFADLNAVMADSSIAAGARIYVQINLTVNTTQQITKNNCLIVFAPGVTWSNGSAGTGIQLSAVGTRLTGARLTGFTTALLIDSASNYSILDSLRFASNTTDLTDNNGKGSSANVLTET